MRWMLDNLYPHETARAGEIEPGGVWAKAEEYVREVYDLECDRTSARDAKADDGTPVQIKSCCLEYEDDRVGRFKIWHRQLRELFDEGEFAFLVYISNGTRPVVATQKEPAHVIYEKGRSRTEFHPTMGLGTCIEIEWPDLIEFRSIEFGFRHYFTDLYSDDVVESVPTCTGLGASD